MGDVEVYVTYDRQADAVYIKLIPGRHRVVTVNVDDDIALNMDEQDRLVGIEVLDASKRLDLRHLLPVDAASGPNGAISPWEGPVTESLWDRLRLELTRRKEAGTPVETLDRHRKNWIEEVGDDYIIVRREKTGNTLKITRNAFERGRWEWSITKALKELASSSEL